MDEKTIPETIPKTMTVREVAELYHISKPAVRKRMEKLPPEAITRRTTPRGEVTMINMAVAVAAWGAPLDAEDETAMAAEEQPYVVLPEQSRLDVEQLELLLMAAREEAAQNKSAADELRGRLDTITAEHNQTQTEVARLQAELDGMAAAVDVLTHERDGLQAQLQTQIEVFRSELAEKNKQIEQLHQLQVISIRQLPAPRQGIFAKIFGRKNDN